MMVSNSTENSDFLKEQSDEFFKKCQDVLNEKVWPQVRDKVKTASLFQGFFVSDEYGQYKMEFYDGAGEIVLEVILDPVCGEMRYKY